MGTRLPPVRSSHWKYLYHIFLYWRQFEVILVRISVSFYCVFNSHIFKTSYVHTIDNGCIYIVHEHIYMAKKCTFIRLKNKHEK